MTQESSDADRNYKLELEKFNLEEAKVALAKRGFWLDIVGKVGIPISLLVLSLVTYISGEQLAENRLQFEKDVSASELLRKDKELFFRSSDSQRAAKLLRIEFIDKHQELIFSERPEDRKLLEEFVKSDFEPDEQNWLLARIARVRMSGRRVEPKAGIASPPVRQVQVGEFPDYVERGKEDIRKLKFEDAVIVFRLHLSTNPNDALVWNYLAYAQMRAGQLRGSRDSISNAIYQQPNDVKTRQLIAINAAKILCSSGDVGEGVGYIKTAAQAIPGLAEIARADGELRTRCAGSLASLP